MKRILLFIVTNLAVMLVLGVAVRILGVDRFITAHGLNFGSLLIFALIFGMGGSVISLLMSKTIAKWSTGAEIITQPRNQSEAWLLGVVQRQAQQAGIGMPDVAIYDAPDPNAFATGASRNHALVAVSTGLLQNMTADEVEAVLGHEISHVANGDMITMTLLQGILNTFVIVIARIIGYAVDSVLSKDEERSGPGMAYMIVSFVMEMLLGVLASLIVKAFSRHREFHADQGGARLTHPHKMIAALERLRQLSEAPTLPNQLAAFGIAGGGGWSRWFMTHPPLEERIDALRRLV
ncbi:MAG: protease HtpX [Pseudomonadota bacterium]